MAFVGQEGDYLAQLDPEKGAFENVALESGAGPHNLIVDEAGQVWFTPTIAIACGSWRQAPSRTG